MTRHPHFHRLPHGRQRLDRPLALWAVVALVLALVAAPFLGQVHRVLHAGAPSIGQPASAASVAAAASSLAHAHASPGVADLFGTHGSSSDCRLYDQLGHADLGCGVASLALPAVLVAAPLMVLREGAVLARRAALFDARGPPLFR